MVGFKQKASNLARVAAIEPGSALKLGLRHHRIQAGPGIHVTFFESTPSLRVLQHRHLDVFFGQPCFVKRARNRNMWGSSFALF
jgi:hypothetical protein